MTADEAEKIIQDSSTETNVRSRIAIKCGLLPEEDREDLKQEVCIHLFNVLQTKYDPTRGALSTFISRVVDNRIKQFFRDSTRQKRLALHNVMPIPDENLLKD